VHNSNHKGNVAEAAIAAAAVKLGVHVLRPQLEHGRYDLVFEAGGEFLRVQCKWAAVKGEVVVVNLAGYRMTGHGSVRSTYAPDEIDAVVAYCEELDKCYWLPIDLVAGMRAIQLRLSPPRNGQRAALNWAVDYELGAVAQLGRARRWQRRGRGFESHQLHSSTDSKDGEVGAHQLREKFGWYMERAAAGEEFLITRRGKPYVRLAPAQPQLPVAAEARPESR
jgi:prevent-host-death family protein